MTVLDHDSFRRDTNYEIINRERMGIFMCSESRDIFTFGDELPNDTELEKWFEQHLHKE